MNGGSEPCRYLRKSFPDIDNNKCKGPEAGGCLECSRSLQEEILAGAQWASGRILVDGVREVLGLKLTSQGGP